MGIQFSPAPEAYARTLVEVPEEPDLSPLVGAMTDLMRRCIVTNPPHLFDRMTLIIGAAGMDPEIAKMFRQYGSFAYHIPHELIDKISTTLGLPA
ncbi:hypothetical protein QBC36DRAFT_295664 [Triangularia setosa]|uniref:Uncharacterized protein n=1 Tax=Triangularia setosa TaxID=2587417 RepID=A0AAN6VWQ9_9PEZI|nr:hypothetical protein QBC36DRAFT_295664 [Podospora setosa]